MHKDLDEAKRFYDKLRIVDGVCKSANVVNDYEIKSVIIVTKEVS
jgi:hypothetical protein